MLDAKRFGLSGGILWGPCLFIFTILAHYTGYAQCWLSIWKGVYLGYSISLWGSVVGLIYGFLDGFVGVFLFAWIYNSLIKLKLKKG